MVATGDGSARGAGERAHRRGRRASSTTSRRRTALFEGAPVVLEDRQGTRIQGRKLLYDLASGSARMLAETP